MPNFYMAFPGGKRKALTLSYDDGVEQDIRLMKIMDQHGLKGTFNISSGAYGPEGKKLEKGEFHRRLSYNEATQVYTNCGHEVAIHALEHTDLSALPPSPAVWEVMKDKENLENQFGKIIRGMAYPFGSVNDELAQTLRGAGIAYARTTVSTCKFTIPTDWLKMPATCHHKNPELMNLAKKFVEEKPRWVPWLFYLWGHSYEFDQQDNWHVIEEFAEYMGNRDDIWYATNIEIYDYVQSWRGMHCSADGKRIFNPSWQPMWIVRKGELLCVNSGEEIILP